MRRAILAAVAVTRLAASQASADYVLLMINLHDHQGAAARPAAWASAAASPVAVSAAAHPAPAASPRVAHPAPAASVADRPAAASPVGGLRRRPAAGWPAGAGAAWVVAATWKIRPCSPWPS